MGGPSPEEGEVRQPTEEEISARAKILISEVMDLPKKSRDKYYAVRLSALEKLIRDLKEYPPGVKYMEDDEKDEDPLEEEGKEAQEILEQYYPGYTISNLEDLRRKLPNGIDRAHILSAIAVFHMSGIEWKLYDVIRAAGDEAKESCLSKDQRDEFIGRRVARAKEEIMKNFSVETLEEDPDELGLFSWLTDGDREFLVEFIKNKYEIPLDEVFKVLKEELGEKES